MKRERGFTLIELAVVVAIFGLLLTILVVPLSTQFDQQRAAETQKQLENVREALIGFATRHSFCRPSPVRLACRRPTHGAGASPTA